MPILKPTSNFFLIKYTISSKLISQVIGDLEINESSAINFKWEGRTVERYRGEIKLDYFLDIEKLLIMIQSTL